jgi:uncharacterized protein involved in cysteine biosynthesis
MIKKNTSPDRGAAASFLHGMTLVFTSAGMLRRDRGLMLYFILPFALNIILLSCLLWYLWTVLVPVFNLHFTQWSSIPAGQTLPPPLPILISLLPKLVMPLILFILSVLTIFIYSITGSIIIAPFNDMISLRVEEAVSGEKTGEPFSLSGLIGDMLRVTANIIRLIFLMIIVNIMLLVLNLIPVAGSALFLALSFFSMTFFLGCPFFDIPRERRRLAFHEKLRSCLRHRAYVTGVGAGFYLAAHIPVMGFLALNTAALAAPLIFIESMEPRIQSRGRQRETGDHR